MFATTATETAHGDTTPQSGRSQDIPASGLDARIASATVLADLLTHDIGQPVQVTHDVTSGSVAVCWTSGPCEDYLASLARGHTHEVPGLALSSITFTRR